MFKFKLVGKDRRGERYVVKIGREKWVVIFTKKGKYRGGHWHSKKQLHLLLSGKWLVWTKLKGKVRKFVLSAGEEYCASAKEIHLVKALENSIHIEPEENTKTFNYEPWRELVEKDR